jgi:hypothetical protein
VHVCCVMCMLCHVCCLELCSRCCRAFSCTGFVEWFHLSRWPVVVQFTWRTFGRLRFSPTCSGLCNRAWGWVCLGQDAMGVEASRLSAAALAAAGNADDGVEPDFEELTRLWTRGATSMSAPVAATARASRCCSMPRLRGTSAPSASCYNAVPMSTSRANPSISPVQVSRR